MAAKILIVDDSRTVRRQVASTLRGAGYEILEAEDGVQGLRVIGVERDLALVICDINMPNMSGLEMLSTLKADPANASLRVMMLTTEGAPDLIQQAKRAGARGWVVKPFKADQLLTAIRKIVGA